MDLYFLGAEQITHTDLLLECGATAVGLSYSALARRAQGIPRRPLAERFPAEHKLLLDSGGYSANAHPEKRSTAEWETYAKQYAEFALDNADRCTLITEFDFLGLGPDWIDEMRRGVWRELGEKFLPVWHPEQGLASLDVTAERFGRLAIIGDLLSTPGQSASSQLMRLARRGIAIHGLALTKPDRTPDNMPFASVASSSWTSPMRYGDIQVWDGRSMHRYPTRYSEQGLKRHQDLIEAEGFDVDAWSDPEHTGHTDELLRVGVWSWLQWAAYVTDRHGPVGVVATFSDGPTVVAPGDLNSVFDDERGSTAQPTLSVVEVTTPLPARKRELVDIPVFGFSTESGELLPIVSASSQRVCDNCHLKKTCEGYEPGAACKFKFPIRVETKSQKKALFNGLVERQAQRVAFLSMSEDQSGGYADPNLSTEIDRLAKLMATQADIEDDRDYFSMTVNAKGKSGVISRLLGGEVGEAANRLKNPMDEFATEMVIEQATDL